MEYMEMDSEQKLQHMLDNADKMEALGDSKMAEAIRRQAYMLHELNTALDRGEKIYRVGPQDRATRRALFIKNGMKMGR